MEVTTKDIYEQLAVASDAVGKNCETLEAMVHQFAEGKTGADIPVEYGSVATAALAMSDACKLGFCLSGAVLRQAMGDAVDYEYFIGGAREMYRSLGDLLRTLPPGSERVKA